MNLQDSSSPKSKKMPRGKKGGKSSLKDICFPAWSGVKSLGKERTRAH